MQLYKVTFYDPKYSGRETFSIVHVDVLEAIRKLIAKHKRLKNYVCVDAACLAEDVET